MLIWRISGVNKFLAGFGLGFAIVILLAPLRGKNLCEGIFVRAEEISDSARGLVETAGERLRAIRGEPPTAGDVRFSMP
jgi:hypothetical protein